MGYRAAMESLDKSSWLGIALVVIGIFVAFKAVKGVIKVVMLLVVAAGLYLWFGKGDGLSFLQ